MTNQFNFGQPVSYEEASENLATRARNLKLKGMLISGLFLAAGLGAMFFAPAILGAAAPIVALVGLAGSAVAGIMTYKESQKLEMDREFLRARVEGRNYWGGYREEVMEQGGAVSPVVGGQGPRVNPARGGRST